MPRYLPVALNLEGRPVLVVGAGAVGTQKVLDFLACGAVVTVVDRTNHHLFQPLLYQVATSVLTPRQIASSIRRLVRLL